MLTLTLIPNFRISQSTTMRSLLWINLNVRSITLLASQLLNDKKGEQKVPNVLTGGKVLNWSCRWFMQTQCMPVSQAALRKAKNAALLLCFKRDLNVQRERQINVELKKKKSDMEFWKPCIHLHLEMLNIFINLALNPDHFKRLML